MDNRPGIHSLTIRAGRVIIALFIPFGVGASLAFYRIEPRGLLFAAGILGVFFGSCLFFQGITPKLTGEIRTPTTLMGFAGALAILSFIYELGNPHTTWFACWDLYNTGFITVFLNTLCLLMVLKTYFGQPIMVVESTEEEEKLQEQCW